MAVFKCKMCGGSLEVAEGLSVTTCEYCGTTQTLPRLNDDKIANLYDRANHFRRSNDYDKAMGIYEQILNEDSSDSEAYWSLVLCRYGIEYVEDPATKKRIPTVNRTQFTSIFSDEDYKSALQYADDEQKAIYEEEAKTIDNIQKGILEISNNEEPFDVFICYKETDNNGRRTPDSVLANDLYHQLTAEGFKVFYAAITLEDKLGSAYEPYIFAALNSAKVMVVLGTKPEFFNAVWVKNEWSRYLALIRGGAKKMLIPAYKDMDPYDLPEEFSHLQAQDMSKLGFMQDLIRGIKKIVSMDNNILPKQDITSQKIVEKVVIQKENKKSNKAVVGIILGSITVIGIVLYSIFIPPLQEYNNAIDDLNNGNYLSAYNYFNNSNYKDSQQLKLKAQYGYVKNNFNNTDTDTHEFLKELKAEDYKDSTELFEELYSWKAKIIANHDENDTSTHQNMLSPYKTIYFHFVISGGEPNTSVIPNVVISQTDWKDYTDAFSSAYSDGQTGWYNWKYNSPSQVDNTLLEFKLYDEDDNLMGKCSVNVEQ